MRVYSISTNQTQAEAILREEVSLCHAPVTGIFVASAIFTDEAIYFEHNYEHEDPVLFEHSETKSLAFIIKKEKNPKIHKIMMAAGGNANKFKSYIPCYSCYSAFVPYTEDGVEVLLLELPNVNKRLSFDFKNLHECYRSWPYSKVEGIDKTVIKSELSLNTVLNEKDLEFSTDLVMYGQESGTDIYMTGSCIGRGGAGTMLNRMTGDSYRDIDIFVIMKEEGLEKFESEIEKLITNHYGNFVVGRREVFSHHNSRGVVFKKSNYHCGNNDMTIDFTFSTNFEGTLAYHAYEVKNWFIKLS